MSKTPDGASYTPLFDVDLNGHIGELVDGIACGTQVLAAAANTTDVANTSVTANSRVLITPRNAAAVALMIAHGVWVTVTAATKLTFTVGGAANAAGTEAFDWFVVN